MSETKRCSKAHIEKSQLLLDAIILELNKPNAEILKIIQSDPFAIESLLAQRTDSEIVFRAFEKNFKTIESIHPDGKKDKEIMERLVRHRNSAFSYADESLRRDKGYVLDLLSKKTNILEFVHPSQKKDREVVLSAVRNAGWALKHVDECLENDDEIVKEAIARIFVCKLCR